MNADMKWLDNPEVFKVNQLINWFHTDTPFDKYIISLWKTRKSVRFFWKIRHFFTDIPERRIL